MNPGSSKPRIDSVVVDCHTHLSTYGRQGETFARIRDHLLCSMRAYGAAHSLVLPDSEFGTCVSDLDTTLDLARDRPNLSVLGTACIPTLDGGMVAKLDSLAAAGRIVGVKLYPGFEEFYPNDEVCLPIYEVCLTHNMPVLFHAGETMDEPWRDRYNRPERVAELAERLPDLKVIIAHFCQPHIAVCRDALLTHPNLHADISGMAHPSVVDRCGREEIAGVLLEVASSDPGKLLFGTDWPLCDVGDHLGLVDSLPIPRADKSMILSGNALRLFPLKLAPGTTV